MAKRTIKKDPNNVKIGARLRSIIEEYYGNPSIFSDITGINKSTLSQYLNGGLAISEKTANVMKEKAEVNKNYLFECI